MLKETMRLTYISHFLGTLYESGFSPFSILYSFLLIERNRSYDEVLWNLGCNKISCIAFMLLQIFAFGCAFGNCLCVRQRETSATIYTLEVPHRRQYPSRPQQRYYVSLRKICGNGISGILCSECAMLFGTIKGYCTNVYCSLFSLSFKVSRFLCSSLNVGFCVSISCMGQRKCALGCRTTGVFLSGGDLGALVLNFTEFYVFVLERLTTIRMRTEWFHSVVVVINNVVILVSWVMN